MSTIHRVEGQITEVMRDGSIRECDTFTCGHGNELVRVKVGTVNQAPVCLQCMRRICKKCQAEANQTLRCVPFEKRLDLSESRRRPL